MSSSRNAETLVRDLVQQVAAEEPVTRRKANTVTAVIGTVATGVAAAGTYAAQNGLDLPDYLVLIVVVAGMIATDLGISRTRNGMTDSTADRLELELARRIDLNHDHDAEALPYTPADQAADTDPADLRAAAAELAATPDGKRRAED